MEDMERYADYNDAEDDVPRSSGGFSKFLKILVALTLIAVIGTMGWRLWLFGYYPDDMKYIAYTDKLTAYYSETDGNIEAKTQKLRFPYDDNDLDTLNSNDLGTFFCNYLILIPAIDELQISARVNEAGLSDIAARYGVDMDADTVLSKLSFRLTDNSGRVYGTVSYRQTSAYAMYRYVKLAFDGVRLSDTDDGLPAPAWIRLEIILEGQEKPYSYTLIYENNDNYNVLQEYKLSKKEKLSR